MQFQYYNPRILVPIFRERGYIPFVYKVCQGCVYTDIPAEDCIHSREDFEEPKFQSDMMCPHCTITINEGREAFHLYQDKTLPQKVAELEEIMRMLNN